MDLYHDNAGGAMARGEAAQVPVPDGVPVRPPGPRGRVKTGSVTALFLESKNAALFASLIRLVI